LLSAVVSFLFFSFLFFSFLFFSFLFFPFLPFPSLSLRSFDSAHGRWFRFGGLGWWWELRSVERSGLVDGRGCFVVVVVVGLWGGAGFVNKYR